jgi:hypothetical protein
MVVALGIVSVLLVLGSFGNLGEGFPVMVALGPAMVLQYAYWRRRQGAERSTWQYRQAELVPRPTQQVVRGASV